MLAGELYSREKKQMIPPPNAHNLLFSHQSNILLQSLAKAALNGGIHSEMWSGSLGLMVSQMEEIVLI